MSQAVRKTTRVILGTVAAVAVGVGIVVFAINGLEKLGSEGEKPAETAYIVRLPQDEDLLRELSRQLMAGTDVEGEAVGFNEIAPAAGQHLTTEITAAHIPAESVETTPTPAAE
jgi:hypothetical protein